MIRHINMSKIEREKVRYGVREREGGGGGKKNKTKRKQKEFKTSKRHHEESGIQRHPRCHTKHATRRTNTRKSPDEAKPSVNCPFNPPNYPFNPP